MSELASLVPASVEARAEPHGRLGVAFGRRFFLLVGVGFIWLVPAFLNTRLGYAMLAWDGLVLLAWAIDLARLPKPRDLSVSRTWSVPVALSVESPIALTLVNCSRSPVYAAIVDAMPPELRPEAPQLSVSAAADAETTAHYSIRPVVRGDVDVGDAWLRYQGPLRLAERWAKVRLPQTVRVYPNLDEAKRATIFLVRSRQIAIEKRTVRTRGAGREFESLREYREGDEFRDICWTAAARRGKLVTRTYQVERSQPIWLVIDSGRLMRTRIGELSKLDHAVNAALSLAQVALYTGDRVGLLAYGRTVRHRVPASRGSAHLRQIIEQLAMVREETAEADHLQAASRLLGDQKRRALVVWLTDLAETSMTPEVVEAAQMMSRHLVLFVVIGQPDLAQMAAREPADAGDMYRAAAAQEVLHRRELLLAGLRECGVLAIEADSSRLTPTLVNAYLSVKERNQL